MANPANKIFVGGLPQNCSDEVLSNYFMQYGTITDSVVMKDRETGNSRGFGFITYETAASVDMVINQYEDHRIENKWVEVKRATPRDQMPPPPPSSKGRSKGGDRDRGSDRGGDRDRGGERERDRDRDRGSERVPDGNDALAPSKPQGDPGCGGCGCPGGYPGWGAPPMGGAGGPYGGMYPPSNGYSPFGYPSYPPPGAGAPAPPPPGSGYGPYKGGGCKGYSPY